mmetsp:Transcript_43389/g.103153  ORF Transcript_43389/g.103153 Transcript_43389/m.103153 type:complete len:289 (-) Transcript_43389:965-1831(-)
MMAARGGLSEAGAGVVSSAASEGCAAPFSNTAAAETTVASGRPWAARAALRDPASSLAARAEASSAESAATRKSTSIEVARRRRLLKLKRRAVTSSTDVMNTLSSVTPAADATPARNPSCFAEVNSARDRGRDTTICVYVAGRTVASTVVGAGVVVVSPPEPCPSPEAAVVPEEAGAGVVLSAASAGTTVKDVRWDVRHVTPVAVCKVVTPNVEMVEPLTNTHLPWKAGMARWAALNGIEMLIGSVRSLTGTACPFCENNSVTSGATARTPPTSGTQWNAASRTSTGL